MKLSSDSKQQYLYNMMVRSRICSPNSTKLNFRCFLNVFSVWKPQTCLCTPALFLFFLLLFFFYYFIFCMFVWIKLVGRISLKGISRQIKLKRVIPHQAPNHTMLLSGLSFGCYKAPLNWSCSIYTEGSEAQFHAAGSVKFFIAMVLLFKEPLKLWNWCHAWPFLTLHVASLPLPCSWCHTPLMVAHQNSPASSPPGS